MVFLYEQPDGTYQEQLRTYEITYQWGPRMAHIASPIPFEYTHEVGRVYRVAEASEAEDLSVFLPHDFSTVRLVRI